jgi:penicillin-binding protein 2
MKFNFRRYRKIIRKNSFLEPEEVLFNKEALSRLAPEENIQKLEVEVGKWGLKLLSYLGVFLFLGSLFFVFYFNVIKSDYFKASAEKNSLKYISIPAERGLIYDRFGKPLLYNKPVFDLVFFPNYLPIEEEKRNELFIKVETEVGYSIGEIKEIIENQPGAFLKSFILKSDLTNQEVIGLESAFVGYPAIQVIRQDVRDYDSPLSFSHLLGYLGRVSADDLKKDSKLLDFERIGKAGLESFYENELRGEPGQITVLRDASMQILGQSTGAEPTAGNNLYLSIDKEFQEYLYNRLRQQVYSLGGERGAVGIVMDTQTGEILSLVSYPGFDNNSFSVGISQKEYSSLVNSKSQPLFNRVIAGAYNPGSTLKPLMAAAGLEEDLIDPSKKIETHGFLSIPNPYNPESPSIFPDWKNHGYVNMYDAIARSSNVYFYILGGGFGGVEGLGIDRIAQYLEKFGFDKLTGLDIAGENTGFVPTPENKKDDIWRIGDTYHASIGQGDVLATPIRLLTDLNYMVNGGCILKPYLVKKITDSQENIKSEAQSSCFAENIIKKENLDLVKKAMIETVESSNGTGKTLNDLPFTSGGKSGTAQTASNTKLNALFFAFAPAENPKISMLILIENAKDGALNAIPVAKDALLWYYQNRGLE